MKFTIHEEVLKYLRSMRTNEVTINLDHLTSCWSTIREITVQTWSPRNPAGYDLYHENGLVIYVDKDIIHNDWLDLSMNPIRSDLPDREILVLGTENK